MTLAAQTAPPAARVTSGDRLGLTVFLAAVIHAIVILGVGFGADLEAPVNSSLLDVVLVHDASRPAPKKADHIAEANQQASGSTNTRLTPANPVLGPIPRVTDGQASIVTRATSAARVETLERLLLTQKRADVRIPDEQSRQPQRGLNLDGSRARIDLKLARLTSELAEDTRHYAQRPRVHYLDTVSAKSASEAAYIKAWIDKVERIGNQNYPEDVQRRKLSGRLVLHVLLDRDGGIVKAFVGLPSGEPRLDEAAMYIIRLAAPYKPFSGQMRKAYDQLMITRTWIFESEGALITQ